MKTISNSDNVIDSRDVIARIKELENDREAVEDEGKPGRLKEWDNEYGEELTALKALATQAEGYAGDWKYGCALIRDSYFNEYMDQMLEDIGDLPKDLPCYLSITVDYNALQMDYTSVDFDGVTYWVR